MHSTEEALEAVWLAHRSGRLPSLEREGAPPDALFYQALLHLAEGDQGACRAVLSELAQHGPTHGLSYEVARWWEARPGAPANAAVYASPAGFESFIQNGSNLALYRALRAELAKIYAGQSELRLLDIGLGTGFAQDGAPMRDWLEACRDAGFRHVTARPLYPYWWAGAHLIIAYASPAESGPN